MEHFDAIIVGAGPAGSVTAYRLARAGASVLLLDKARFPRDKPCGGGLTVRALRELPFDIQPVVERAVENIDFSFRGHRGVRRGGGGPLAYMTQRRRLDHFLVEQAAAVGAVFRDGVKVSEVSEHGVRVAGTPVSAELLIGADGVNGASARSVGLGDEKLYGVALEGNLPLCDVADPERWRDALTLELGSIFGGYAWVFPKRDHLNVGVAGWEGEGPRMREHFKSFCTRRRFDKTKVEGLRGYRLVVRCPGSALASTRALLVGDAAGLMDPLLGDGLSAALVSARLAAEAALDFLAGRIATLEPYARAVIAELGPITSFSWNAKSALERLPRTVMTGVLSPPGWRVIEKTVRGEMPEPRAERGWHGAAIWGIEALAWLGGRHGEPYRMEVRTCRPGRGKLSTSTGGHPVEQLGQAELEHNARNKRRARPLTRQGP
jgi:geranylgeranyl reductase family protein